MYKKSDVLFRLIIIIASDNKCIWEQWGRNSRGDKVEQSIANIE